MRQILRSLLRVAGPVFALCGFVVAQPLFDLLGNNPTFFVAHGSSAGDIVLFTLVVLFVPPLVVLAVLLVPRLVPNPKVAAIADAVVVGLLGAIAVVTTIDRSERLATWVYVTITLILSTGFAIAYARLGPVRQFTRYLTPAPVLFAVFFLFFSPVNDLLFASDPAAYGGIAGTRAPVVVVILDEFPLGAIVDESGSIDEKRFPGFAELARRSTWYPNAASISRFTQIAVPAMLSGELPKGNEPPIAANHPRNLFTMLGRSHDVYADEILTNLCPDQVCGEGVPGLPPPPDDRRLLFEDAAITSLHQILPDGLADAWLPRLGERFAGFGRDSGSPFSFEPRSGSGSEIPSGITINLRSNQRHRFESFLDALDRPAEKPRLTYLHVALPHVPYVFLPNGAAYINNTAGGVGSEPGTGIWIGERFLTDLARSQFMLQARFTDLEVQNLLDRLDATGELERSLVIVASDHGTSFEPGGNRRPLPTTDVGRDDIMPVPLFVKYPDQERGSVDRRIAETIDILPTISDSLDLDLPSEWSPDGRSLLGDDPHKTYTFYDDADDVAIRPGRPHATNASKAYRKVLGPSGQQHDLYRLGPYGDLVGRRVGEVLSGDDGRETITLTPDNLKKFAAVDVDAPRVPAFYQAEVGSSDGDEWVAVSVNDVVAGVGKVYTWMGERGLGVVLDPSLLRDGANEVRAYEVSADSTLVPIPGS